MESACECGIKPLDSIKNGVSSLVGHAARIEENRTAFKISTGKPTGRKPLGRPRLRWQDNIIVDLK